MTIADKLTYLAETKTQIKNAIVAKGVEVADTDPFRSYAEKIAAITGGGGGALPNVVVVGHPTIAGNTLSGVSGEDYVFFPQVIFQAGTWEVEVGFETGSDLSDTQYLISTRRGWDITDLKTRYGISICIDDGMFNVGVGSTSSWIFDTYIDDMVPQPNTRYKIKVTYDGTQYDLYVAIQGEVYSHHKTLTGSAIGNVTFVDNLIGVYGYTTIRNPWKGKIFLNEYIIRNNDVVIYEGVGGAVS